VVGAHARPPPPLQLRHGAVLRALPRGRGENPRPRAALPRRPGDGDGPVGGPAAPRGGGARLGVRPPRRARPPRSRVARSGPAAPAAATVRWTARQLHAAAAVGCAPDLPGAPDPRPGVWAALGQPPVLGTLPESAERDAERLASSGPAVRVLCFEEPVRRQNF